MRPPDKLSAMRPPDKLSATRPPERIDAGDLVLKRWEPQWAEETAKAVNESLVELRPFLNWIEDRHSSDDLLAFIERSSTKWVAGSDFKYAVFLKAGNEPGHETGDLVGSIGLMSRMGPDVLEIGYWLRTSYTGRGYMTAAVDALARVALALPGIDRVAIRHDAANVASGAVAARAGFVEIGREACEPEAPGETGTDVIRERRC